MKKPKTRATILWISISNLLLRQKILTSTYLHAKKNSFSRIFVWKKKSFLLSFSPVSRSWLWNQDVMNSAVLPFLIVHQIFHLLNPNYSGDIFCKIPISEKIEILIYYSINHLIFVGKSKYMSLTVPNFAWSYVERIMSFRSFLKLALRFDKKFDVYKNHQYLQHQKLRNILISDFYAYLISWV